MTIDFYTRAYVTSSMGSVAPATYLPWYTDRFKQHLGGGYWAIDDGYPFAGRVVAVST